MDETSETTKENRPRWSVFERAAVSWLLLGAYLCSHERITIAMMLSEFRKMPPTSLNR